MPLATRMLPWLVLLLALAALPVSLAALRSERWDDCADPEALRQLADRLEGDPAEFQPFVHGHVFQRTEGTLPARAPLQPLRFRIVRSDEARYPVEQATRFLRVPMDPERRLVRPVEMDGRHIPIHLMDAHFGKALRVVASLYVYDGQPVEALLPLQLRSALSQLVRGRRPITLFQVHGHGPPELRELIEEREIAWLRSAWRAYQEVCAAPEPGPAG